MPTAPASGASDETFLVKLTTSKGDIVIEVHPEWSPSGAARFRELIELGFYDECRFFRVLDGFMAQVGMSGDTALQAQWGDSNIPDDPVKQSNTRGFVTFAQQSIPNTRSTQFFINYGDNSFLDGQRFAPFGKVIEGMDVAESLYGGYGEGAPQGNGPSQGMIAERGNEYLNSQFPMLDYIVTARIVDESAGDASAADAAPSDAEQPAGTDNESSTNESE